MHSLLLAAPAPPAAAAVVEVLGPDAPAHNCGVDCVSIVVANRCTLVKQLHTGAPGACIPLPEGYG
eukprot:1160207-Pelagomonas_calceolata.AAC.5